MRDFMASRVVAGRQQIKAAITFHTAGEEILWPYGYTKTDVPYDMTKDDQAALVAIGRAMAKTNGYEPKQSSSLYVTDGDEIDHAYGVHRIWMYTFELYPSHDDVSSTARFYPPDEVIGRETTRNRAAILYLLERAACRHDVIGKARTHCGPLFDDFEVATGWVVNRSGTDTATAGTWQRTDPAATSKQLGTASSGSKAVVTGASAGTSASSYDLDGGITTYSSPLTTLPDGDIGDLTFRYYFAHGPSATSEDWFRAYVQREDGSRTMVHHEWGQSNEDAPGLDDGHRLDGSVGRRAGPDRVRCRGPWCPEPDRGRRGRRADHAPVAARGNRARNVVPPLPVATTSSVPPWASASDRAMASPSPDPPDPAVLTNRSKTWGRTSGSIPGPVSSTRSSSHGSATAPVTVTDPPAGVWRIAFATRLASTSRTRTGSTSRIGRSAGTSARRVTPAAMAVAANERTTSSTSTSGSMGSRWSGSVPPRTGPSCAGPR